MSNVEQLIEDQNNHLVQLQQAITNYKKSSKDRKTLEYIEKYQRHIDDLWNRFQRIDNRLRNQLSEEHDYFKKDLYALLEKKYFDVQTIIEVDIKTAKTSTRPDGQDAQPAKLMDTTPTINHIPLTANSSAVNTKLNKQRQIIVTIKRLIHSVLTNTEKKSHQFYDLNLKTIRQHWSHAQLLHNQLWANTDDNSDYDFDQYVACETEINEGTLAIIELMEQTTIVPQQEPCKSEVPSSVRLPQIELPKFDGTYLQWRQFHDLFIDLVHISTLKVCQKMVYLKSSLSGEAKTLIAHFSNAVVNYDAAWKVLVDRSELKRILVNALLSKLLQQPYSNTETSSSLKLLHDVTHECLLSLHGLNISTEQWDPLLLHILVQRLSKASHSLWEQFLANPKELPSITEFLDFLRNKFQSLEALQSNSMQTTTPHTTKKVLEVTATVNNNCSICNNSHQIYSCQKFLSIQHNSDG